MKQYIIGTPVEIEANFINVETGQPADPITVTAEIRLPDLMIADLTSSVNRVGVGDYRILFSPTQNGLHQYRVEGDGNLFAANEGAFKAQSTFV